MFAHGMFFGIALSATLGSFVSTTALASDTTFFAILTGGNAVSAGGAANAGDTNGYGSASIIFRSNGELCYSILVTQIKTPTSAHIHRAAAGVNGPVIVSLTAPASGNPGDVSNCIAVDPATGGSIRNAPAGFYVTSIPGISRAAPCEVSCSEMGARSDSGTVPPALVAAKPPEPRPLTVDQAVIGGPFGVPSA